MSISYQSSFFVSHVELVGNANVLAAVVGQLTGGASAPNPIPAINTLAPASLAAGSASQTLTVNGTGFLTSSTVTFNGGSRTSTFVNASQLTIPLSSADLATVGTYPVIVTNPAPGGGASSAVNFTVSSSNPIPSIATLSPSSLVVNATPQTLTINGTGFLASSTVTFDGISHTATYSSASQLTMTLTASDLAATGTYPVVVTNPAPGGGASTTASFSVTNGQTAGQWTWMSGSNTAGATDVYGTLGVPAAGNVLGARTAAISWADRNGNAWIFGGASLGDNLRNNMWEFNSTTNEWTCLSADQIGVYGTPGIPDPANVPPARTYAISWTDGSGNLWLFGGIGGSSPDGYARSLNDLWKFNATSKVWTWMSGYDGWNGIGSYGTLGVPDAANVPGSRATAVSWSDSSGNLWLFGGIGPLSVSGVGRFPLNDLWRFNTTTNEWTWVSGSAAGAQPGVYGTRGVPDIANVPGARLYALSWVDPSGNLWLFGGLGSDSDGRNYFYFNDLWEFNPTGNTWTWVSGADTANQSGVSGTQGVPTAANVPGARLGSVGWIDEGGNLWLFGGQGYDIAGMTGMLNDLWKFDPASKTWTWVSGSSALPASGGTQGIYGTMGVPDPANVPGSREMPVSWTDNNGSFWLFGGYGDDSTGGGYLNDLWRYQPPVACGTTHYNCSPSTISATNKVEGPSKFRWTCSDGAITVQCSQPNKPIIIEN